MHIFGQKCLAPPKLTELLCLWYGQIWNVVCVTALLKEIDSLAEDYLNNVRTMSGEMRKEHLEKIEKLFSKSKEFGDDKVQLAMQTYEMVTKTSDV